MESTGSVDVDGGQTDNGARTQVARGQNAVAGESWDADAPLRKRLFMAAQEIPILENDGENTFHKYNYTSRNLVVGHAKSACFKHGIDWDVSVSEVLRDGNATRGTVTLTFINVDNPETDTWPVTMPAEATDKGDKGASKLVTMGEKFALMKALKIVTTDNADDSDRDGVEYAPARQADLDAQEKAAMILGWATTMRTSIENADTTQELTNLAADCAGFFESQDVPETVKADFRDLIKTRRKAIAARAAELGKDVSE